MRWSFEGRVSLSRRLGGSFGGGGASVLGGGGRKGRGGGAGVVGLAVFSADHRFLVVGRRLSLFSVGVGAGFGVRIPSLCSANSFAERRARNGRRIIILRRTKTSRAISTCCGVNLMNV